MKYIIIFLLSISPVFSVEPEKKEGAKDAARIEILLRQQRELEADEIVLAADKNKKDGSFEEAIDGYKKAISLYQKSSASEKRIINKLNHSGISLTNCYKAYAEEIIKKAEKESSVELFDKAKNLLKEAKNTAARIQKLR